MKFQYFTVYLIAQLTSTSAFTPVLNRNVIAPTSSSVLNAIPTPEESAQALTNYMAKAHEEKIKALKSLEDKKNAEIAALKEDIKSGAMVVSAPAVAPAGSEQSVQELTKKLLAYQKFMSEYIVKAQEDKARAVKAAEIAVAKKYEDKLNAFMLNAAPAAEEVNDKLYKERNAKIAAAAKAGSSRWGNKEVEKVGGKAPPIKVITAEPVRVNGATVPVAVETPPEVIAADHGLRADGGVGGLSLAERVANGAAGAAQAAAPVQATNPYFEKRNAKIAAAVKAGKQSRWGGMEEERAIEYSSNTLPAAAAKEIVVIPEVEAADHGLRADGGVSGPSLAERVNLGAQLLQ